MSVALSAVALGACAPHSYELGGQDSGGAAGSGAAATGSGGSSHAAGGASSANGGSSVASGGSVAKGGTSGSGGGGPWSGALTRLITPPTKLDLLFVIDSSLGMQEKQARLSSAIPTLLARFTTPRCVDADGNLAKQGPSGCADGNAPEFSTLRDIHIGVITSSLGDHGSNDVCSDTQNLANISAGERLSNYNDYAQLLPSVRDGLDAGDNGFLTWDPASSDPASSNPLVLVTAFRNQLDAVGELGCGYEAQLESWYRFLVDPEPVSTMSNDGSVSVRGPVNDVVLAQRAAFLRPDSVLAIVMLSDENDCSIMDEDGTDGWLVGFKGGVNPPGAVPWHMPRATSACDQNPLDPCCRPCTTTPPDGCPSDRDDSSCAQSPYVSALEDNMNLRCFKQVSRFGIDLLYPVSRYVDALGAPFIHSRFGGPELPNPIRTVDALGNLTRDPSRVVLAGIVGVPWQDIATPDSLDPNNRALTFMTADELAAASRWDVILGDPDGGVAPTDPFMVESIDPRPAGTPHPLLPGVTITSADAPSLDNPINGHEQAVLPIRDDLQFACIYPLDVPVACTPANADGCDCNADEFAKNSPLCTGTAATHDGTQSYGKAYPGMRELEVLKDVGISAVVGSICPKNTSGALPTADEMGYVPALTALADRLQEPFTELCLPQPVSIEQCALVEVRPGSDCGCDPATGRGDPSGYGTEVVKLAAQELEQSGLDPADYCSCQILPLSGDDLDACKHSGSNPTGAGFCYIDGQSGDVNPALLARCKADDKRRLRFVGDDLPASNALMYFGCSN